jgi:thiol-disulfide isomerase/thioredoxin
MKMKNALLALTLIFYACLFPLNAQKVIENPQYGLSIVSYLDLTKIEFRDSATVMSFAINRSPGNWVSVPKETFLLNPENSEKLFVLGTEGIPFNEQYWMPDSGQVVYKVFFPPVNEDWETVDYGEDNEGGNWAIYDIRLKPHGSASLVPRDFKGNWYNAVHGELELVLLDTHALYKNEVWKYQESDFSDDNGYVTLSGNIGLIRLYLKSTEDGKLLAGESPDDLSQLATEELAKSLMTQPDNSIYTAPVFTNDSATFSGFIAGYSPRVGFKTFTISVNGLLTGEQSSKTIRVLDNGEFSITIPFYYPNTVYVRSPFNSGQVFLEPGKELFAIYDGQEVSFMGELGLLNQGLLKMEEVGRIDYGRMQEMILDMSPLEYKAFYAEEWEKALQQLSEIEKEQRLAPKVRQIKELDLAYGNAEALLSYEMNFNNAYRRKHEIPYTQRELPIEIENPPHEYYDFLTPDFVNNPLAVMTNPYHWFINRLMFSSILSDDQSMGLTTIGIADAYVEKGNVLKPEEAQLIERLKYFETSEARVAMQSFNEVYEVRIKALVEKYSEELNDLLENSEGTHVTITMMGDHLKFKEIEITGDEKEMVEAYTAFQQSPFIIEMMAFYSENGEAINLFHSNHRDFVNKLFAERRGKSRNRLLSDSLGIEGGLVKDVMNSQEFTRSIVSELTPVSQEEIEMFQKSISTPFIAHYAEIVNNHVVEQVEANKSKKGYQVNEVPKTEADQLFEAMMGKFKGKVVYVDFWASWCGPCRSGIENIMPLKEELKDEEVVFVYITNQSTPEKTWENMIPDIKGEHFRVSTDEWNYLSEKFNISGIPHYVLVDKKGLVVKPNMGFTGNAQLKKILLDCANEQE